MAKTDPTPEPEQPVAAGAAVPEAVFIEAPDDTEVGALAALAAWEADNYARAHQTSPIIEE